MEEWKKLEAEAESIDDADLVRKAQAAARQLAILWREALKREHNSDFHLSVQFQREGVIIVEGYRTRKMTV